MKIIWVMIVKATFWVIFWAILDPFDAGGILASS